MPADRYLPNYLEGFFYRVPQKGLSWVSTVELETSVGGPSVRGQAFVDIEIRVAIREEKFILQRNF